MFNYEKIILNGLNLMPSEDFSTDIQGLFDSNNNNTTSDLYTDGRKVGNTKLDSKTITITVYKKRDNFKAMLQLNHIINQGEIDLEFKIDEDDNIYYCKVLKESIMYDDIGNAAITFIVCDPNIYLRDYKELSLEKRVEGGFLLPASFTIPDGFNFIETELGNVGEIINEGFQTIYPEIIIEGDGSNFEIMNKTTGETLYLDYSISTDDRIYIDCNPKSRKVRNNNASILKYKHGVYLSLIAGTNNIEVNYDGEVIVTVRWREAYV